MSHQTKYTQNTLATFTGVSAGGGYMILNLAAATIVGLPLAIASGLVAGVLNSIFHSLPVQQAEMPRTIRERVIFSLALIIAAAATGYIYLSAEKATSTVISRNPYLTTPIAFSYQASYALPISFLLTSILKQLLKNNSSANPLASESAALLNDSEAGTINNTIISASASSEESTTAPASPNTTDCQNFLLKAVCYMLGIGMLISISSAAYQLSTSTEDPEAPLSALSQFYRLIYGTNFYLSLVLHLPILLLAAWGNEQGLKASYYSLRDIMHPTYDKSLITALVLGILLLTSISTYLISSYGEVNLGVTTLALMTAILGNLFPAVISANASVNLASCQPREAANIFADPSPVIGCVRRRPTTSTVIATIPSENNATHPSPPS